MKIKIKLVNIDEIDGQCSQMKLWESSGESAPDERISEGLETVMYIQVMASPSIRSLLHSAPQASVWLAPTS